jgi:hypothetical protein
VNRQFAVILALSALAVAALCVSIGSFVLLWADRRDRRHLRTGSGEPSGPAEPPAPEA